MKDILKQAEEKMKKSLDRNRNVIYNNLRCLREQQNAEVAELADAHGSGPCGSNTLWVQLPSSA